MILCIGETLEQREGEKTFQVIASQLAAVKGKLKTEDYANIVIAYEPVWAIGTGRLFKWSYLSYEGKTASPDQAEEVHKHIREYLIKEVSSEVSEKIRIIYGGIVLFD